MQLKSDTYCAESTIHFPTDLNLLWDSARKCLDTIEHILSHVFLPGWRKLKVWRANIKKDFLHSSNIHRKKGANYKERLKTGANDYLFQCEGLSKKVAQSIAHLNQLEHKTLSLEVLAEALVDYYAYLIKHIDLVRRRIIKGEKIPHNEKVFSIFEPHVEWIQKGKENRKVELGHNVLITSDQYHFIIDHEVVIGQKDVHLVQPLLKRLKASYDKEDYVLGSISFDRGFYSALNKKALAMEFGQVIMPKRGKKNETQAMEESEQAYVEQRRKHSAVEANINELEHTGANRVPDKTLKGFKKYVAWSVLAYNLKRLGKVALEQKVLSTAIQPSNSLNKAA